MGASNRGGWFGKIFASGHKLEGCACMQCRWKLARCGSDEAAADIACHVQWTASASALMTAGVGTGGREHRKRVRADRTVRASSARSTAAADGDAFFDDAQERWGRVQCTREAW